MTCRLWNQHTKLEIQFVKLGLQWLSHLNMLNIFINKTLLFNMLYIISNIIMKQYHKRCYVHEICSVHLFQAETEGAQTAYHLCLSVTFWLNLPVWVQTTSVFDLQLSRWRTLCSLIHGWRLAPAMLWCSHPSSSLISRGKHPQSWCLDIYVTTLSAQIPERLTQPVENRDSLGWNQTSDNSQRGSDSDSHSNTHAHTHTQLWSEGW